MATLLIGTEGGEGLGHVAPWACLVNQALARGWQVHMASPNVGQPQQVLGADGRVGIWQSPVFGRSSGGAAHPTPKSWPELLLSLGYGDSALLGGAVKAWVNILRHVAPNVVVADYAPALILAARVVGVACVEAGMGFCVPPWETPPPCFPGVRSTDSGMQIAAAKTLCASMSTALRASGYSPGLTDVCELGTWPARRVITSVPEMDVYGERTGVDYAGFLGGNSVVDGAGPTQPLRVFGYLKPGTPGLLGLIDQLCEAGITAFVVIPDGLPHRVIQQRGTVTLVNHMVDVQRALRLADVYLSNGGMHGVGQALVAGRWPVVVPMQAEQVANARNLVMRQWGAVWLPEVANRQGLGIEDALRRRSSGPRFDANGPTAEEFLFGKLESILLSANGVHLDADKGNT